MKSLPCAEEHRCGACAHCQQASAEERIVERLLHDRQPTRALVQRNDALNTMSNPELKMVPQISSDRGGSDKRCDPDLTQVFRIANSGQLQKVR